MPTWFLISILVLCAALPYLNTLGNEFVYDDSVQVLENPYIQNLRYIPQIFTTSAWSYTGQGPSNYYRPMMSFGYLLCYEVFGRSAFGFHLVNILLHVAVVAFVFLLTIQLLQSRSLAFWAAALFALHPVHTESVAWIGAVTDLELTVFYLLTFFFFLRTARPAGGIDRRMQIAMLISFGLAAISKEQALTLPLLAAIYEHFFRPDRTQTTWSQQIARYDLLWIAAAAYMVLRIRLLGTFAPVLQFSDLTKPQIALSAIALLGHYFWMLIFPAHLCAFYVFHRSASLSDWRVLAGAAAVVTYVVFFFRLWKREHDMAFAQVWLLLTLLPVLNAKWVGQNVFAERYLYLPSIGFCWLLAWVGIRLWKEATNRPPVWRKAFAVGVGVLAVLACVRIVTRNSDWHDNFTFYRRTLAASPDAYLIRINLGAVYDRMGDPSDAEREWTQVLKSYPENSVVLADLGMLYARQHLYSVGAGYLQRAIQADPQKADAHIKLGFVYFDTGELDRAKEEFDSAIKLAPMNISGYVGIAYIYWKKGKNTAAEEQLDRAEAINPSDPRVHYARAQVCERIGELDRARQEYKKALRLDPVNAEARAGLLGLDSKVAP